MIRIMEVGPRDGLQNEKTPVPTAVKAAFVSALVDAGLREIEATSFVSPKWVPQLGDAAELWPLLPHDRASFVALVPNLKGLERAMSLGVSRIALFTAASDAFTMKNINMTIDQSIEGFRDVISTFRSSSESNPPLREGREGELSPQNQRQELTPPTSPQGEAFPHPASSANAWVRGYVSTAFECPYEGRIAPEKVLEVCRKLLEIGIDELSLGDTIGVATPTEVRKLTKLLLQEFPSERIAYHFHDTRGTAMANVACALEDGIRIFDSSASGLGGCPYAPGAGGNLATEDLVYFLEREGVPTGIDPERLAKASLPVLEVLGRSPSAKAQLATLARCEPAA